MPAIGQPYLDVGEFKSYLVGTANANLTGQDDQFEDAINTASREIDTYCARQFNRAEAATARTFEPESSTWCYVDDFWTTDDLVIKVGPGDGTFPTTLTAGQYKLSPSNGVIDGMPGWPSFKVSLLGGLTFPCSYFGDGDTLQVTAKWGWEKVPAPIKAACKIMAAETWKLKDAPFGVLGLDEFGVVRVRQNKMAVSKLYPYSKNRLMIG